MMEYDQATDLGDQLVTVKEHLWYQGVVDRLV